MREPWWRCLFLALVLCVERVDAGNALDADESVMFFPGLSRERADGSFTVDVEGWVFELEKGRVRSAALASYLDVDLDRLTPGEKVLFDWRTRYFRTDSERWKRIDVRLCGRVFPLSRTDRAGRVHGTLDVGRECVQWKDGEDGVGSIPYTLEAPGHAAHGQQGFAWAVPRKGVSIVSDIDDTIKISNVLDKKALLRNTFLEPFQAVPGMAEWYREMTWNEPGVFFHYLSAAPMQLYPHLADFLRDGHFPSGILHLRESTSWRTLYAGQKDTVAHKKNAIVRLLSAYPEREFILVGDSGESDPEIYADIARRYPKRILAIYIRDVTREDRDAARYRKTFTGIDPKTWQIRN